MGWKQRKFEYNGKPDKRKLFNDIYRKYHAPVYANIFKIVKDPVSAEDVFQETFMTLWMHLHKFETENNAAPWLFVVSHNKALSHLKKMVKESLLITDESLAYNYWNDTETTEENYTEQINLVKNAVNCLKGKRKEIFTLNKFEGFSVEEIAAKLELQPATVKEYIKQAIREIRRRVAIPGPSGVTPVVGIMAILLSN